MVRQYAIASSRVAWTQYACFYCRRWLFPDAMAREGSEGVSGVGGCAAGEDDPSVRPLRTMSIAKFRELCKGQKASREGDWPRNPALNGVSLWELIKVPPFVSFEYRGVVRVSRERSCDEEKGVGQDGACANRGDGVYDIGLWAVVDDVGDTCHPSKKYRVQRIKDLGRCTPSEGGCTCQGPFTGSPVAGAVATVSTCNSFQLFGEVRVVARGRITHLTPLEVGEYLAGKVLEFEMPSADSDSIDFALLVPRLVRFLRGVVGVGSPSVASVGCVGASDIVSVARQRFEAIGSSLAPVAAAKSALLLAVDSALVELDQVFSRCSFESYCGVQGTPLAIVSTDGVRTTWNEPLQALHTRPYHFTGLPGGSPVTHKLVSPPRPTRVGRLRRPWSPKHLF